MTVLTLKVIASLLQLHGPGATIQSDHQGIDSLLGNVREQISDEGIVSETPAVTDVYFRRGGFIRGGYGGGFRRAGYYGAPAFRRGYYGVPGFRRGGFLRGY